MHYANAILHHTNYDEIIAIGVTGFKDILSDKLEIESSMALSKYQAMSAQAENAKHKLQEKTPAFTTLQNASVPLRPSAPKRVFFCLGMLILATIVTSCRIFKTELYSTIVFFSNKKTTD